MNDLRFTHWRTIQSKSLKLPPTLLLVLALGAGLLAPHPSDAAILPVTSALDSGPGTLRAVIPLAKDGDVINFSFSGPITLTSGELVVNPGAKSITIAGPGPNLLTVQRSPAQQTPAFRIFNVQSGTVTISGLTIADGQTTTPISGTVAGGGILNSGTLFLDRCVILGNSAVGLAGSSNNASGGGICNTNGHSLTITNSVFTSNTVAGGGSSSSAAGGDGKGGGIYNEGFLNISTSTINGNTVTGGFSGANGSTFGQGGGLASAGATCTLLDCTVANNQATGGSSNTSAGSGEGGGTCFLSPVGGSATNTMTSCTISGNQAFGGGGVGGTSYGGGTFDISNATVGNTILAGNAAVNNPDCGDILNSADFDLIGNPGSCLFVGTTTHNITGVSAKLGNLKFNGGPTPTIGLNPGSPAIDAGSNIGSLLTDQRGFARTVDLPGVPNQAGGNGTDIGAFELRPTDHADYNGDGFFDLVLQSSSAQLVAFWFTNGVNVTGSAYATNGPSPINLPPNWQVAGVGDFNGDGVPDLVLDNTATGQIAFWFTSGSNVTSGAYATSGGPLITLPAGWLIAGVGDFNGDSQPDLLLMNPSSGQLAIWYTNGTNITSGVYVSFSGGGPATLPSGWQVVTVGDFNGDGRPDIVLDNPGTGQIAFWLTAGSSVTSGIYATSGGSPIGLPSGWQIAGAGDYNGDGQTDLVLQNLSTGQLAVWYANGTNITAGVYVLLGGNPATLPPNWKVVGPR